MNNPVTHYIREHGLQHLCTTHSIAAKRHTLYPNLVLLKYNQIESTMSEPVVQHCRGLILDEAADWRIVCWGYNKFFNDGEGHAATIDWSTARVYEKEDGSLMQMYWYDGAWQISSSGLPDASGNINGAGKFSDLFWNTWATLGYRRPDPPTNETAACYLFELCTKDNRIVVQHPKSRIVLHGARRLNGDFSELHPEPIAAQYGWECIRSYPLNSFDAIQEACKTLDPMQSEGYVVRDAKFNRVKVKSPQYVAISHLKDGMSTRRLLEIVRANESEEFLSYYPEWKVDFDSVKEKYNNLIRLTQALYERHKAIVEQKDFAMQVKQHTVSGALFAMRNGKATSFQDYFSRVTITSLEHMTGLKTRTFEVVE